MKQIALIAVLVLACSAVHAGPTNSIAVVFADTISSPDKVLQKIKAKQLFDDNKEIEWDDLAKFQAVGAPATTFHVVIFAVDVGKIKKNITKANAESEIKNKLSDPSKCTVVACGVDPIADLAAAGFEPIPLVP